MKWIKVKENPPTIGETVWLWTESGIPLVGKLLSHNKRKSCEEFVFMCKGIGIRKDIAKYAKIEEPK